MVTEKGRVVDLRVTLSRNFFGGFYFVVLIGKEKRKENPRLIQSERRGVFKNTFFSLFLVFALFSTLLVMAVVILYLVKTWAGINLFVDSSPIPDFLKTIRLCH